MKMRKGRGRSVWVPILLLLPVITILICLLVAKLILTGSLTMKYISVTGSVIAGIVAVIAAFIGGKKAKQKKFIWAMIIALGYGVELLIGNLLFFGVSYGPIYPIVLPILGGGFLGGVLSCRKQRKIA